MHGSLAKSFANAFRGLSVTFRSERSFRIHVVATCAVVAVGLYLGLSPLEWGLVVLAIGLVFAAEVFNTAIERLGDAVSGGKQSQAIRDTKDVSAAAVLLAALTALVIGIVVLLVPLVNKLVDLF